MGSSLEGLPITGACDAETAAHAAAALLAARASRPRLHELRVELAMLVTHVTRNVMIDGTVLRLDGGYHR
jgi:hypothetical protein